VIEGNTVTITVRARQSILKSLTEKDFEAVADFANLSFTGAVPIEVTALRYASQISIERGANTMMRVSIEDLSSVDKVVATKAEGTVITGKALGTISVEPSMIRIEGAKTTIDRIASVYAVVNVSGISEDCSFVVEPVLYDSEGNRIDSTDITFSEESLKVNVTLLDTKTVPVQWNIDVETAEGYGIESLDYNPSEVEIAGSMDVLDTIDAIVLDDYVADDISQNLDAEVDLEAVVKELGVVLARPESDKTAKLAVRVSTYESRSGAVNVDSVEFVGKSSNYTYSIVGDSSIAYTLYGLASAIDKADSTRLSFSLDVTGLEPGTYTVNLQLTTTQKLSLESEVPVIIKVDSK
jgi:YbbR domain-containing protein